ncbi:GNAT family N-acetyltransferase [Companilactobacillus sp. HBUAS56275]|uniref:GNAT family N-acetyltransferase n=1 Tax=Candidatus Companilactobacillus pullicola TaxID=2838523 RepID=A0A9D1ZM50_9LACO|nr:GNAT family N-acetyltransferase [Candidatus Companilactobacillus pullicola]
MDFNIVKANQQTDFKAIKELYYQTWTYDYIGIVPQKFLDHLTVDIWHPKERVNNTLLATVSGKIVGICTYGPGRRKEFSNYGEVYSLYVLPKFQHQGIGRKLFQSTLDILQEDFDNFYLLVLKDNLFAQAFCEMFEFEPIDEQVVENTAYGNLEYIILTK